MLQEIANVVQFREPGNYVGMILFPQRDGSGADSAPSQHAVLPLAVSGDDENVERTRLWYR